jgi:hypothetical protein
VERARVSGYAGARVRNGLGKALASRGCFASRTAHLRIRAQVVILMLSILALVPCIGRAQDARPAIVTGDRVRISAPALGDGPRVARVVTWSPDTLVVRPEGARDFTVTVPLAEVTRIEVPGGHRPRKARFALIGAAGGGVVGAVAGAASYSDPCVEEPAICAGFFYDTRQGDVVAGALGGVLLGAIGGAVLGQLWQRETWTALPLRRTVRMEVSPERPGLASRGGSTLVSLRIGLR